MNRFSKIDRTMAELKEERDKNKLVSTPSAPRRTGHPTIESIRIKNSSKYPLGENGDIKVQVLMSEPVIVTREPAIKINFNTGKTKNAKYKNGSGTKTLLFVYTVRGSDRASQISVPDGKIIVPNGSSITSVTGTNANLIFTNISSLSPPLRVTDEFKENIVNPIVQSLSNLSKSRARFPQLVVEGKEDRAIVRWIEEHIFKSKHRIGLQVAEGRNNLLEIYNRRDEYPNVVVAFMADLDHWVLKIPNGILRKDYPNIIWTTGYSIENDLYTDGDPISLIPHTQITAYNNELNRKINKFLGEFKTWWLHIFHPNEKTKFGTEFDTKHKNKYHAAISANIGLKVRGKEIFEVLEKYITPNRKSLSERLINTACERGHYPLIKRLILEIENEIDEQMKDF